MAPTAPSITRFSSIRASTDTPTPSRAPCSTIHDESTGVTTPTPSNALSIVIAGVDSVTFSYFGSVNDFSEPKWMDTWPYPNRVPQMVRVSVKRDDGTMLPDLVAKVMLGEEAGCLENSFQRLCRPRVPT